jgi:thioredoxin 1
MVNLSDLEAYSQFVHSCPAVVIHFWAEWNASDRLIMDKWKELESTYSEKICFGAVDVDNEQMVSLFKELKIANVPTLAYYKNGELVEMIIGLRQPIKEALNSLVEL